MAFEEYSLLNIRTELIEEFGLDTSLNTIINRRINKAIKWIIRQKNGLWPWQIKDLVVDVTASGTGTADFTQDSDTATRVTGAVPVIRDILSFDSSTDSITSGFLVTAYAAPTITLDAKFVGATVAAKPYTTLKGYYQLPSDFQRLLSLYDTSILQSRIIKRTAEQLEEIRREQSLAIGTNMVYSVEKDPLVESHTSYSNDLFLVLYPYPAARTTVRGRYVADHQTLTADADVPLIPRNNREVIVQVASWFLAMTYKEPLAPAYRTMAEESMADMLRDWDFAVDPSEDLSPYDTSIGPVAPPAGFPDWFDWRSM